MQFDIKESKTIKFNNIEEIIDSINNDLESGAVILNRHGVTLDINNKIDSITVDTVLVKMKHDKKVYSMNDLSCTIYFFEPEVDEYMTRHFGKPINLTSNNRAFESCLGEDELDSKQNTKALEDLFSKSTDEIVDGLVQAADGDHELALRNLEKYMNTHDGFNRNILSAHQKLQNKVESMKNSKFNKMIGEALSKFNEDNDREKQVYEVASTFACDYTCAEMADRLADTYREIDQTVEKTQQKINELNITEKEFEIALDKYYEYCKSIDTACIFNTKRLVFNS